MSALMWRLNRRASIAIAFVALGVFLAPHDQPQIAVSDRFVTIEAPIESDWSARDHFHVLRASHFLANGAPVHAPIGIYARFDPAPIVWQAVIRVEGFLRRTDDRYSIAVKSSRLMTYGGRVSPLAPSTWNRAIEQRLQRYAATYPAEVAMIDALVLGRGERLSDDAKENFRRGGTYHLLVFSGLQIALAAAVIAFALRWAGAPRVSDWSLIAFAALAPPFIGPTASVSRASVGIALYAISRVLKRPTSFENLWCVAALVRLIIAPRDLTDPAFHLTYAGAGALIFIGKPFPSRWVSYAVAAELVITPLTLFHFHQFALGGSVTTIVLTPIIFVMLIVGSLFCATEITLLLKLMRALNAVCSFLNDLSAPLSGFFAAPPPPALAIGLIAALVAIATLRDKRRAVAAALALTIPTTFAITRHVSQRTTRSPQIAFLDVGQGDAILLRSGWHNVLVDGGGRIGDAHFGETVLLPLLVDRGVRRLDIVMLSHAHPDHCGGLPAVLEQLRVSELWINPRRFREECAGEMLEAVRDSGTPVRLIRKDAAAQVGELHIEAFTAQRGFRRAAENNSSIVVRVEARRRAFLLTGDIEREAEAELAPRIRPVDLLKVPHHGSRSSSTPALLDAARPRVAVISCGAKNWFGHPHASVVNTLSARHIQLWRTDENGTIDVIVDNAIFCRPQFDTPR
ncbi:MAG TPA: DNA internalization-related competence protein ComEC/Rec2 [Thermoanaerobaculia bacterium]